MRQELALTSPWVRGIITWLVYTTAGVLALGLASPQDHVMPLYLPAGFGLAFVLGWGTRMVWPVGLGSATVLCIAHWQEHGSSHLGPLLIVAGVTCLGAALQVWVGARWARIDANSTTDLHLEHPLDIGRFLLIAGPVACLINAALSVPPMVAVGLLPAQQAMQAALSWWAGDTLGVLIGTPLLLTLVGRPTDLWRARRWIVGLPLLVTTLLLGLTIHQGQRWEHERAQAVFDQDTSAMANAVKLRLNGYRDALEAMHGLFIASDEVSRQEFRKASTYWLESLQGIQAMGWNERVLHDQLSSFEAQQRAHGLPNYTVYDTLERKPPTGLEMVAIRFIEPQALNEGVMGYNILSSPAARNTFEQARRENRALASEGFKLAQETGQQKGVVLYRVVYQGQPVTPQERVQASKGTVFLAMRMDDTIRAITSGRPSYLSACLLDASAANAPLLGGT
ncbi:MAG: CHASE domain-containing protein, partial [Pseudomonadota bacterium]